MMPSDHYPIGTRKIGLATLAGTVIAGLSAYWMSHNAVHALSPVFRMLLNVDVRYVPWFALAIVLAVVYMKRTDRIISAITSCGRYPWRVAALTLMVLGAIAPIVYKAHPVSMDEYAVVFQSKVFAAGHLTGSFPHTWLPELIPLEFQNWFLIVSPVTDDVISGYWPGFALLMAPFSWLGVPWLCNPVLTAITTGVLITITRKMMPDLPSAPGWAVAFLLASPAVTVQGVSFYAMTSLMLANLLFLWGFLNPRPLPLFWSGVVGSIALTLHNPVPHALFAIPWIVWLVRERGWSRDLAALILGYLPLSLLFGIGWVLLRGHIEGAAVGIDMADPFGSLTNMMSHLFSLPNRAVLIMRAAGITKLWLWAAPGLLVLATLGWWRSRFEDYTGLLFFSAYLTLFGYFFIPVDQGHGWGYRYFHSAWFVLPILAARYVASPDIKWAYEVRSLAAGFVALGLILVTPVYLIGTARIVDGFMSQVPPSSTAAPLRVTFVYPQHGFYAADLVQNDPFLRGGDLRLLGNTPQDDEALVRSLSPDAQKVAQIATAIMWHLPVPADGLRAVLTQVRPHVK